MAKQQIWLVDNDPVYPIIVEDTLRKDDREFAPHIESAAAAIEKINSLPDDAPKPLIITDNDMEHENVGMEVIKAAHKKGLKVIMMSSWSGAEAEAIKNGATDFWKKDTADFAGLRSKVDAALVQPQDKATSTEIGNVIVNGPNLPAEVRDVVNNVLGQGDKKISR